MRLQKSVHNNHNLKRIKLMNDIEAYLNSLS